MRMMNPETLRDVANVVLIVGLVTAACGTFGVNYFRTQVEKARAAAEKDKQQQSDNRAATLQAKVNDIVVGKDELLRQNSELSALVRSLRGQVGERDLRIEHLNNEIAATKRYSYVANLTFNGMAYVKGDVTMPTEISVAIEGTWFEPSENHFRPVCETAALQKNRNAIRQFPDFPFSYYALAYCLQKQGVPDWRSFAEKATAIFEQTTTIGGHQKSHDECLAYLRQLLGRSK